VQLVTTIATSSAAVLLVILISLYLAGAFRRRIEYRFANIPAPSDRNFATVVARLSDSILVHSEVTGFWVEADDIFAARTEAILSARRTLHFETYEMDPGKRANDFADLLIDRAKAGVKVQIVADGVGSKEISPAYWKRLRRSGVDVRFFHRFRPRSPADNLARTHRKILAIDGETALIGGAGIADMWDGKGFGGYPWLDFEVRLRGSVVGFIEGTFAQHWSYAGGTIDASEFALSVEDGAGTITVATSGDPLYRYSPIDALFQLCIASARHRLWIASPYFIPNDDLRRDLIEVARRGVQVRLLTMGPKNDRAYAYYVARECYRTLLEAGVEIYEYHPSMMHAKAILVDNDWVSFGSANFDPRSLFLNDELNFSLGDRQLITHIETFFKGAFENSNFIDRASWKKRPLWQQAIGRLGLLAQRQL